MSYQDQNPYVRRGGSTGAIAAPVPAMAGGYQPHAGSHAAGGTRFAQGSRPNPQTGTRVYGGSHAQGGQRFRTEVQAPRAYGHAEADAKPHRHGRVVAIALGSVAGVLLVAYVGGVAVFSNVFYPHTSIAGVDVSLMTGDSAASRVDSSLSNYKLTVTGSDFSFTYKPDSASTVLDSSGRAKALLALNQPFAWPVRLVEALTGSGNAASEGTVSAALPASFDEKAFDEQISQAVDAYNKDKTGTFDNASAFDEKTGQFSGAKALSNVKIDKDKVTAAAKTALASLSTSIDLDASYFAPIANGASDEKVQAACDAANKLIAHKVTLTMGGANVMTIDAATLAKYVVFGDDLTPTLDTNAMTEWLRQYTADNLDTVGTQRTYTRANGNKTITISGGTYGWNVDSAALATQVRDAVTGSGDATTIEVPTKSAGATFEKRGAKDWGAYVDVDLTEQHAYYYDETGALKWESGVISGNPTEGNDTPMGVYTMLVPERNITLIGKSDPVTGEPIYKTPVSYWMPFVGSAVGLHDASWQADASFSNNQAFKSVGSHGCVNLPPQKAAELYGMVKQGICVIVHQ